MSDPLHPSPNPLGAAAPSEDRVGLAANAMASAMAISVACIAVVTWATTKAARSTGITSVENIPDGLAVNLVIYGTVSAIFISGGVAFWLMSPIDSNYRRGGLAMVGAFGGFLLSVLLTILVRGLFGEVALLGLSVIAAAVALFFVRRARAAR